MLYNYILHTRSCNLVYIAAKCSCCNRINFNSYFVTQQFVILIGKPFVFSLLFSIKLFEIFIFLEFITCIPSPDIWFSIVLFSIKQLTSRGSILSFCQPAHPAIIPVMWLFKSLFEHTVTFMENGPS